MITPTHNVMTKLQQVTPGMESPAIGSMATESVLENGTEVLTLSDGREIRTLTNGVIVEELPDYSSRVILPEKMLKGGLTVVFRDPTQEDSEFLESQLAKDATKQEAMRRFGCRLCTQWGDKPGVTMPEWAQLRAKASLALIQVLDTFFL
jgi:hypothetical protein